MADMEMYEGAGSIARGSDGSQMALEPNRTLHIRYTDGCVVRGMVGGAPDPLIIEAATEAIIDIPVPVRLVLGVASPEDREAYRGGF